MATVKITYVGGVVTTLIGLDVAPLLEWIKDETRPIHCVSNSNNKTFIFKDKICFIEVSE